MHGVVEVGTTMEGLDADLTDLAVTGASAVATAAVASSSQTHLSSASSITMLSQSGMLEQQHQQSPQQTMGIKVEPGSQQATGQTF